jgi:peptidoglycan/LPS O-acetylase OafA/YrhL
VTRHYPALDGLRGMAAIAVVFYHIGLYFQLRYIPAHGYLAVDFFFILSGYVIAHAYDDRLATTMSLASFVRVRLIRLYPLALLGVSIGTVAMLIASQVTVGIPVGAVLEAALMNAALLPTSALLAVRPFSFPIDTPLWSLSLEIWINIVYALFFPVITRRVLGGLLVVGAALLVLASAVNGGLNIGLKFQTLYLGFPRVLFAFVAGVLLQRFLSQKLQSSYGSRSRWAHAACLPLLALLLNPSLANADWANGAYDAAAVLFAFPAILCLAAMTIPLPRLEKFWSQLGAISYPLYVTHFPFVLVISNLAHKKHWHGAELYLAAVLTFMVALVVSVLALQLYDVPVRRFLSTPKTFPQRSLS